MIDSRIWVRGAIAWDETFYLDDSLESGNALRSTSHQSRPGGSGANTARALALLGLRVEMNGYVGSDENGEALVAELEARGIGVEQIERFEIPTSKVLLFVDPSGERTIIAVSPERIDSVPFPASQVGPSDAVFIGSGGSTIQDRLVELHEGVDVFVAPDNGTAPTNTTFVIGSESQFPTGDTSRDYSTFKRAAPGLEAMLMTKGDRGTTVVTDDRVFDVISEADCVLDSTGAGDVFAAGVIGGLARGYGLEDAANFAAKWAAKAVGLAQSTPPEPPTLGC